MNVVAVFMAQRGRKGETLTGRPHGAAREGGSGRAPTGGPYCVERGEKGEGRWAANSPRPGAEREGGIGRGLDLG